MIQLELKHHAGVPPAEVGEEHLRPRERQVQRTEA